MKVQSNTARAGELWHKRLGHPSGEAMNFVTKDLKLSTSVRNKNNVCKVCFHAKQTRSQFQVSESKAEDLFETIHCDIWEPYRVPSSYGADYLLTLVDDASRGVWLYLMKEKSEVEFLFKGFVAMVRTQFDKYVKMVRTDNGLEFKSGSMKSFYAKEGIIHQTSCVDTPQQNRRLERKHRHILNVARALRFQANLPLFFWGECVLTAAHLINRTPSKVLGGNTPYEVLFHRKLSYDHLRVFGSLCFAQHHSKQKDKFGSRNKRCIIMGYPYGKKAYKLYDLDTNEFFESRDAVFNEHIFPFDNHISYVENFGNHREELSTAPRPGHAPHLLDYDSNHEA